MHTKVHFLRAVLEAVGFSLRQILEALEENKVVINSLYAGGGFIGSAEWVRIITDILGKTVSVSHAADASAMGAVYMGMKATGILKNWGDVKQLVRDKETYKPDAEAHAAYQENYNMYQKLYSCQFQ